MAFDNTHKFTISLEGDVTGEKWFGEFECKKILPHGDQVARDALRREMLGVNPQFAEARAANQAWVMAELSVRLTKTPDWWSAAGGAPSFLDNNLVKEVYEKAQAPENKHFADLAARAEKAKKELRENAPKEE